jgi:hypothetical protein
VKTETTPKVAVIELTQFPWRAAWGHVSRRELRHALELANHAVYRLFRAKVAADPLLGS